MMNEDDDAIVGFIKELGELHNKNQEKSKDNPQKNRLW